MCRDELLEMSDNTLLKAVFENGKLIREDTFLNIRERLYGGSND